MPNDLPFMKNCTGRGVNDVGWLPCRVPYSLGGEVGMSAVSHCLIVVRCVHSTRHSTRLWARENKIPSPGICAIIVAQIEN